MPVATFQIGVVLAAVALVALAVVCWQASAAESRARLLLRDVLTDAEYQQIITAGYLEIMSPEMEQRVYRSPRDGGRVRMYERGQFVCELCLRPTRPLPQSDLLVLHKLMIEGSEADYLATANHFAPLGTAPNCPSVFKYL